MSYLANNCRIVIFLLTIATISNNMTNIMKQKDISKLLKIDESLLSRLLSNKRQVSWPLAERLSNFFPGRSISEWKRATPEELKAAFHSLNINNINVKQNRELSKCAR